MCMFVKMLIVCCYAKGEFLHLNFLSNKMRTIGAVIA